MCRLSQRIKSPRPSGEGTSGTNRQPARPVYQIGSGDIKKVGVGWAEMETSRLPNGPWGTTSLEAGPRLSAPQRSVRNGNRSETCFRPVRGKMAGMDPGSETAGRRQQRSPCRHDRQPTCIRCKLSRCSPVGDSIRFGGPGLERGRLESNAREPVQLGPNQKRDSTLLANFDPGTDSVPRAPRHDRCATTLGKLAVAVVEGR